MSIETNGPMQSWIGWHMWRFTTVDQSSTQHAASSHFECTAQPVAATQEAFCQTSAEKWVMGAKWEKEGVEQG